MQLQRDVVASAISASGGYRACFDEISVGDGLLFGANVVVMNGSGSKGRRRFGQRRVAAGQTMGGGSYAERILAQPQVLALKTGEQLVELLVGLERELALFVELVDLCFELKRTPRSAACFVAVGLRWQVCDACATHIAHMLLLTFAESSLCLTVLFFTPGTLRCPTSLGPVLFARLRSRVVFARTAAEVLHDVHFGRARRGI